MIRRPGPVLVAVLAGLLAATQAGAAFPPCDPSPIFTAASATPLTTGLGIYPGVSGFVGFVGSGNLLKAIDPATGEWQWSVAMSGTILADPLPAKLESGLTVVIVTLSDCHVACVRATDGSLVWSVDPRTSPDPADALGGTPAIQLRALSDSSFRATIPDDLVFVTTRYATAGLNRVFALNAKDGTVRWAFGNASSRILDPAFAGPVVDLADDRVYVGTDQNSLLHNTLWAIDSRNGGRIFGIPAGRITQRPLLAGGRLYTTGADNVLRATDCVTTPGTLLWSLALASTPVGDPAIVPDTGGSVLVAMSCGGDVLRTVLDSGAFPAELVPLTGVTSSPVFLPGAGCFFARIAGGDNQQYDTATQTAIGFPATLCGDPTANLRLCELPAELSPWQLAVSGAVAANGYLTELCIPWPASVSPRGCTVSVVPGGPASEGEAALAPPFPNPMSSGTRLAFTTPGPERAIVLVSDVQGRRVRRLVESEASTGGRSLVWDGRDDAGRHVPSGLYTARLVLNGRASVRAVRSVLVTR